MANIQRGEDVKDDYILRMGEKLGSRHYALYQELSWLYVKWQAFDELYGSSPSRINLLNKAAPAFFRIVQDSLRHDIIIHIARLTDPAKTFNNDNLTICALTDLVDDDDLRVCVEGLVKDAQEKTKFVRDWRNKRIAHNDLSHALQEHVAPLESASREKISSALKSLADVINAINRHYVQYTIMFDANLGGVQTTRSLITVLDDGVKAKVERTERKLRGEIRAEDSKPHNLL